MSSTAGNHISRSRIWVDSEATWNSYELEQSSLTVGGAALAASSKMVDFVAQYRIRSHSFFIAVFGGALFMVVHHGAGSGR